MRNILNFNVEITETIELLRKKEPDSSILSLIQKLTKSAIEVDSMAIYISSKDFIIEHQDTLTSCDYDRLIAFGTKLAKDQELEKLAKKNLSSDNINFKSIFNEMMTILNRLKEKERVKLMLKLKTMIDYAVAAASE